MTAKPTSRLYVFLCVAVCLFHIAVDLGDEAKMFVYVIYEQDGVSHIAKVDDVKFKNDSVTSYNPKKTYKVRFTDDVFYRAFIISVGGVQFPGWPQLFRKMPDARRHSRGIEDHANWNLLDHENCGKSADSDRIIGGKKANLGQYPWLVRLGFQHGSRLWSDVQYKCGGALINKMYVLSAAHCVANQKPNKLLTTVRIGEYNTTTDIDCVGAECAPYHQDIEPDELIVHEKYNVDPFKDDIALIRLKTPAILHKYVRPICLPRGALLKKDYVGTNMEVAGWGVFDMKDYELSETLLTVNIPINKNQKCLRPYQEVSRIDESQVCAGGIRDKDSCQGDSGGPLMKPDQVTPEDPPQFFVFGLVSFGAPECGMDVPAVYTNVRFFLPWILDNIKP